MTDPEFVIAPTIAQPSLGISPLDYPGMKRQRGIPRRYKILIGFIVFLALVRLTLPSVCLHFINSALAKKLGTYEGHLDDFDFTLYRSAYQLQGLTIKKKNAKIEPILKIKEVNLSLAWRALARGEINADVGIDEAVVTLADAKEKTKQQYGTEEPKSNWQEVFDMIIPISIESLTIYDSSINFTNHDLGSPLPVSLSDIQLTAKDLRTRSKGVESPLNFSAIFQRHAPLKIDGALDILSIPARGKVNIALRNFKVKSLNKYLLHYVPLDITSGTLNLFAGGATAHGNARGYVKFFLKDADIVAPDQNYKSAKHFLYEIGGSIGNWILKNNKSKRVAAKIPFEYASGKLDVNASDAFWSAIKNSYDEMKPGFDKSAKLEDVPRPKKGMD